MQPVVLDPLQRLILEVGIPLDDPAAQDLQVNLPPPIMQEAGLLQDNNIDCNICRLGRRVNRVFLLCGHCVCSECADNIVIWEGTDATCPNMSKCFFLSHACAKYSPHIRFKPSRSSVDSPLQSNFRGSFRVSGYSCFILS